MKKLITFDDYMLEMLSEAVSKDKLNLVISTNLKIVLESISDNTIAKHILLNSDDDTNEFKVTYLDIDDSNPNKKDMISFMNSNKVIDQVMKDRNIPRDDNMGDELLKSIKDATYTNQSQFYKLKTRSKTSIGRIVGKLFPNKFKEAEVEEFVNRYKASRDTSNFEIVTGETLRHWYHEKNYAEGGSSLNGSCMKDDECQPYMDIYVENPDDISLLILKDKNDPKKIRGRALVWNLYLPSGRTFLDRIYTTQDSEVVLFKEYAKEHGWIYKVYQNADEGGPWYDTKTNKETVEDLVVYSLNEPTSEQYPYMDTMKFFDGQSISNSGQQVGSSPKKLEDVDGGFDEGGEWVEHYNEYIPEDVLQWCDVGSCYRKEEDTYYSEFYDGYVAEDYAEEEMEELDHAEDWDDRYRKHGDYITTYDGNTCDEKYAENNFVWSEYHGDWLEDGVYSEYYQDLIARNEAVEVYTDAGKNNKDWRIEHSGDGGWWTWDYDDEMYDDDVTEEELKDEYGFEYSDFQEEYINSDEAVEVYTDVEGVDTDWRDNDKGSGCWWVWDHDGEKYCDDITKEELREYHGLDDK